MRSSDLTSRERVLKALRCEAVDRTPFFEKLVKSPVADEVLGRPHAAVNFEVRMERLADGDWHGLMLQEARDTVELAEVLGFDMIRLYPNELPRNERPERVDEGVWKVGGATVERLESGWVRQRVEGPVPSAEEQEEATRRSLGEEYQPPTYTDEHWVVFREARRLIEERALDLAIFAAAYTVGAAAVPPYIFEWFVRDRETLARYYERQGLLGRDIGLALAAEGTDLVALGGDMACDHGPMVSPADYRELMMPQVRMQSRAMHEAGALTSNASDGDLWPVLDDYLIGAEVEAFEEIDIVAGMDMARLQEKYGGRVCMVGNMDIRHLLTSGTAAEAREATVRCIEDGAAGGHVLMSSNCIHESVKMELFMAYVEAYHAYW